MNLTQKIVISGTSLFLLAIEAGLAALPEVEVTHIDPHLAKATGCITALEPDIVLVDRSAEALAQTLRQLQVPFIEVDARESNLRTSTGTLLPIQSADDLLQAIGAIVTALEPSVIGG